MMTRYKKIFFCSAFMFISFHGFAQFVIVNTTLINTDSALLKILGEKSGYNATIVAEQTLIYTGLKDIKNSKIETRVREYEKNGYDKSLTVPLASNLAINTVLYGTALGTRTLLPFYRTAQKEEYFARELAINNLIALRIGITSNGSIRNANTQELYALDQKMLAKLKKTNESGQRNAALIILASLLAKTASLSADELNTIFSLGL